MVASVKTTTEPKAKSAGAFSALWGYFKSGANVYNETYNPFWGNKPQGNKTEIQVTQLEKYKERSEELRKNTKGKIWNFVFGSMGILSNKDLNKIEEQARADGKTGDALSEAVNTGRKQASFMKRLMGLQIVMSTWTALTQSNNIFEGLQNATTGIVTPIAIDALLGHIGRYFPSGEFSILLQGFAQMYGYQFIGGLLNNILGSVLFNPLAGLFHCNQNNQMSQMPQMPQEMNYNGSGLTTAGLQAKEQTQSF